MKDKIIQDKPTYQVGKVMKKTDYEKYKQVNKIITKENDMTKKWMLQPVRRCCKGS